MLILSSIEILTFFKFLEKIKKPRKIDIFFLENFSIARPMSIVKKILSSFLQIVFSQISKKMNIFIFENEFSPPSGGLRKF
jgi:hypothetical protein